MALHLVVNPSAGHRHAQTFYSATLAPLLAHLNLEPILWHTQSDSDGVRVGKEIRAQADGRGEGRVVVLVLGGDGSAYELINGFFAQPLPSPDTPEPPPPALELVAVPLGTANALFSHLVHARARAHAADGNDGKAGPRWWEAAVPEGTTDEDRAKLEGVGWWLDAHPPGDDGKGQGQGSTRVRLPLTRTTFHPPSPSTPTNPAAAAVPPSTLSHIVLSLALHASLIHLSEALRPTHPGIGRFKLAADAVLHVRHEGALVFPEGAKRWDPREGKWARGRAEGGEVRGPFAYVLATTSVERLEPAFLIAPLLSDRSDNDGGEGEGRPTQPTMDVLVLRPERSAAVRAGGRKAWEACVREVLGGAYQGGKHIDLLLADPAAGEADDGGPGTLEYYRARAFDFYPAPPLPATPVAAAGAAQDAAEPSTPPPAAADAPADVAVAAAADDPTLNHLVCADGAVLTAPEGGHVQVRVLGPGEEGGEVWVWT